MPLPPRPQPSDCAQEAGQAAPPLQGHRDGGHAHRHDHQPPHAAALGLSPALPLRPLRIPASRSIQWLVSPSPAIMLCQTKVCRKARVVAISQAHLHGSLQGTGPRDVSWQSCAPAVGCGDGAAVAVCVLRAHGVQAAGVARGARDALDAISIGVCLKLHSRAQRDCQQLWCAYTGWVAHPRTSW